MYSCCDRHLGGVVVSANTGALDATHCGQSTGVYVPLGLESTIVDMAARWDGINAKA